MTMTENELQTGRVVGIAGPVIDVEFPRGALPEINVEGNGLRIADGDTMPRKADGTGFGKVLVDGAAQTSTFTSSTRARRTGSVASMIASSTTLSQIGGSLRTRKMTQSSMWTTSAGGDQRM